MQLRLNKPQRLILRALALLAAAWLLAYTILSGGGFYADVGFVPTMLIILFLLGLSTYSSARTRTRPIFTLLGRALIAVLVTVIAGILIPDITSYWDRVLIVLVVAHAAMLGIEIGVVHPPKIRIGEILLETVFSLAASSAVVYLLLAFGVSRI